MDETQSRQSVATPAAQILEAELDGIAALSGRAGYSERTMYRAWGDLKSKGVVGDREVGGVHWRALMKDVAGDDDPDWQEV